jgi:hypothetical protein
VKIMKDRLLAVAAGVIVCAITVAVAVAIVTIQVYGWGLFVLAPVLIGFASAWTYTRTGVRTLRECFSIALMTVLCIGLGLLAVRVEGIICLAMALPLALPLALLGALVAYKLHRGVSPGPVNATLGVLLILTPGTGFIESALHREAQVFAVRSAIEIDAPPERVWTNVVSFSDLPAEREWLFHTGVAYPIRARIDGTGPGAIRECIFSTGPFIEPIEVWDAPLLLRFSVTHNPEPMQEWSPGAEIHPPHLNGYLVSKRGQFLLTRLPGGRTRLEGTTWYQHHMWPAAYWTMWSDYIIHRIHMRVLNHVKTLSERAG